MFRGDIFNRVKKFYMFEWLYLINKGVLNILGIEDVVYICFVEKGIADLNGTILPVVLEVNTIVTVLQLVLGYPLTVIISSLRCYSCHFGVLITQINLQPLIDIIGFS